MRVLENGGTVEQHKAAVAAATAMKFTSASDNCSTTSCDTSSFLAQRALAGCPTGPAATLVGPTGPAGVPNKKGFSKYPSDDMSTVYNKPGGKPKNVF